MTRSKLLILAVALTLAGSPVSFAGDGHGDGDHEESAHGIVKPGGAPAKHHPVHGPGSSHDPIIRHPPRHGAGSGHNPIVVPPDCNDPNTLCRRP